MKRTRRSGFTIVELVVVVLLLGILSAVALPRFLNLDSQAHQATVEGTIAALQSSLALARSVWLIEANGNPAENLQVFGTGQDGQIDFNADGWPSQQWFGGIEANPSTDTVEDCVTLATALLTSNQLISTGADGDYQATYLGSGDCRYTYMHTSGLTFDYDSNTGLVTRNF